MTPISEEGYTGVAIGAAFNGLRPIVEFQFIDFIANAFNMIGTKGSGPARRLRISRTTFKMLSSILRHASHVRDSVNESRANQPPLCRPTCFCGGKASHYAFQPELSS